MRIMPHDWVGYVMLVIYSVALIYIVFQIFFLRRDFNSRPEFNIIHNRPSGFNAVAEGMMSANERRWGMMKNEPERLKMSEQLDGERISTREHLINTIVEAMLDANAYILPESTRTRAADLLDEIEKIQKEVKDATSPSEAVVKEESNLVAHARREMEIVGEDDWTKNGILKVVQAFADMGHSGGSAMVCIPMLNELLNYRPLSPLTDDPDEWVHHGEAIWGEPGGIWQNKRNSEAFSHDKGKTYYLVSQKSVVTDGVYPMHESSHKKVSDG